MHWDYKISGNGWLHLVISLMLKYISSVIHLLFGVDSTLFNCNFMELPIMLHIHHYVFTSCIKEAKYCFTNKTLIFCINVKNGLHCFIRQSRLFLFWCVINQLLYHNGVNSIPLRFYTAPILERKYVQWLIRAYAHTYIHVYMCICIHAYFYSCV